jgi:hypothetical protein
LRGTKDHCNVLYVFSFVRSGKIQAAMPKVPGNYYFEYSTKDQAVFIPDSRTEVTEWGTFQGRDYTEDRTEIVLEMNVSSVAHTMCGLQKKHSSPIQSSI